MVHDIGEHLLVYLAVSAVALNEVAHLQHHAGVLVDQQGCPFQEAGTTVLPHGSVAGKLGPLYLVEPLVWLIIIRMVYAGRIGIEVGVAQDYEGVPLPVLIKGSRWR